MGRGPGHMADQYAPRLGASLVCVVQSSAAVGTWTGQAPPGRHRAGCGSQVKTQGSTPSRRERDPELLYTPDTQFQKLLKRIGI